MNLFDIAQKLGISIDLDHIEVSKTIEIKGLNTLQDATSNQISFLENNKYLSQLETTKAAAVFVTTYYTGHIPENCIALICDAPYTQLAHCSKFFALPLIEKDGAEAVVDSSTTIMSNVTLGLNVTIGANSTIMAGAFVGDNVTIGDNCIIYPNVTIYRDTIIGSDVTIHSGTVIGSDGFGFATNEKGEHIKIYQNGNVTIGSNVEIGANCTIDRAAFASTIIESMVRIDNLVHIAHNCKIGYGSVLVTQTGLSGSTTLGEYVVMAGQSATTGHLCIAPHTTISGRGVVSKSITEPKKQWAGFPLMEHRTWLRMQGKIQKLCFPKNS